MGAASRDQVVKTVAPDAPFAVSDQTPGPGSYSLPPPRQRRAKGFSVSLWYLHRAGIITAYAVRFVNFSLEPAPALTCQKRTRRARLRKGWATLTRRRTWPAGPARGTTMVWLASALAETLVTRRVAFTWVYPWSGARLIVFTREGVQESPKFSFGSQGSKRDFVGRRPMTSVSVGPGSYATKSGFVAQSRTAPRYVFSRVGRDKAAQVCSPEQPPAARAKTPGPGMSATTCLNPT